MRLFEKIFICVLAVFAPACANELRNAGDPGSREFLELRILECLIDPDCPVPPVSVSVPVPVLAEGEAREHDALIRVDGRVRIWGLNGDGQLGFDNTTDVGDGSGPSIAAAGHVAIGGTSVMIAGSNKHSCALLSSGAVRCWGKGANGRLGYNSSANVGDGIGSTITGVGDVPVGGTVTRIAAGVAYTCALLSTGSVRCWGLGLDGRTGYNGTASVGDGTTSIIAAGDVPIGGTVAGIAAGGSHACALLTTGNVRCWGKGSFGRPGYGNTNNVGDGIGPTIMAAGDVLVGDTATQIAAGSSHTCALLSGGTVRCWGNGSDGRLGHDNTNNIADGIGPAIIAAGDVPLGGVVTSMSAGGGHTCVLLNTGAVRCWGLNSTGQLGYGNTTNVGDGIGPSIIAAGDVPLGGKAVQVVAGNTHTCAVLDDASVRCWGAGANGRLGYNSTANVGDGVGLSIIAAGNVPYQ